ncbi:hypothetical protein SynBIOSE41_02329 [Synechococcus sp. BIOS-E4-1]|nr:hypothetical protein SynBIOSE41_02329 [Synechococcus sp. BIOS-E4-1]
MWLLIFLKAEACDLKALFLKEAVYFSNHTNNPINQPPTLGTIEHSIC